jgi:hypothetical protein
LPLRHQTLNSLSFFFLFPLSVLFLCQDVRRQLDLAFVSVLLDAGAGNQWEYICNDDKSHCRSGTFSSFFVFLFFLFFFHHTLCLLSNTYCLLFCFIVTEGLAVASFEMFENGFFSSDKALKSRVNSLGLASMDFEEFTRAFQVSQRLCLFTLYVINAQIFDSANDSTFNFCSPIQVSRTNPMKGLKGRYELLKRLGGALDANPKFFGAECPRPGNVVDYVLSGCNDKKEVSIEHLWSAIIEGLENIWPAETQASVRRGDVWHFSPLKTEEVGSCSCVLLHVFFTHTFCDSDTIWFCSNATHKHFTTNTSLLFL